MEEMKTTASELVGAIKEAEGKKTAGYDTTAEVRRITDGTAWVHIPGGVDETPVALTISAEVGDTVQIRVAGGSAWITGNRSKPPTDDTTAVRARGVAIAAQATAMGARSTAEQALNIAEGVDEHFWYDNTGAHVTQVTQEDWNDSQSAGYHSGGNTLITSGGVAIRDGMMELATFGASRAQIGQAGDYNSRLEIGTDALKIIKSNGNNPEILLSHLGYGTTKYNSSTMPGPFYTLGTRAAGDIGYYSFAEGSNVIASGIYSHAENHATASGSYSHAEGDGTASGSEAHAEGSGTTASGSYSHAEGSNTVASGTGAHASGQHTIAQTNYQTVIGAYNVADTGQNPGSLGDFVFIIGNGTSDNGRSNAFTVSWDGNVEMAGSVQSFFKVVDLSWSEPAINAHDHGTTTTHTVPAADRPDGMSLVGIVGWTSGNYRIYPYVFHVNGDHSISVTMANATAANSTAATIHVSLLYIKATTA